MNNAGLQRHIVKADVVWDLPDVHGTGGGMRAAGAVLNDWQLSAIFTGGSGARCDVSYVYQNNGANVNITGSPDYAGRVVINGDTGSGCSKNRFSQFNTASFSDPPESLGLDPVRVLNDNLHPRRSTHVARRGRGITYASAFPYRASRRPQAFSASGSL